MSFLLLLFVVGCAGQPEPEDPMQDVDVLSDVDLADSADATQLIATDPGQTGLFSGLFRSIASAGPVEPDASPENATNEPTEPLGLLARFTRRVTPEATEPEAELVFGELRSSCGTSQRDLGVEVAKASGFRIFDSDPGQTALRPHYITGFSDGCPRRFLAALVLTGDVGTHEVVRYSQTRVRLPYSATDNAYEEIKARFCGAPEGAPCGARLERLGQVTTFVTAYRSFGSGPEWAEFLLHRGKIAAVGIERL